MEAAPGAAPAADAAAAAAALGQQPQPTGGTGTLGSAASGGYEEVELQPHSSSISPPTAVDPATDAATTILQAEEWGAAARAAEAADGAARRMREAAMRREEEAVAEDHVARRTSVDAETTEDLRAHRSPMDDEAQALGFSLPLSGGEARSVATLMATPKRTPGQKLVMVDRRTLGAGSAVSDLEEYGTPEEIPSTPKSSSNATYPIPPLMMFGETDSPGWGTGGLDELAERVAEHVVREDKATATEDDGETLSQRCLEALSSAAHYANLEWGARAAATAVEEEAATQVALMDQVLDQAETAAAAVSALTAANLATEDPLPEGEKTSPPKKKGAVPKKKGKWDTGAPLRRGRSAAKLR